MTVDVRDPELGRAAMSLGGRPAGAAEHLGLAQTQAPPEVALDETRTPLPPALDRTLTPLPPALERTLTPLPDALEQTRTPSPEEAAERLAAPTRLSDGEGRPALPLPANVEDRRVKDLVKGRLFRSKARPVKIGRFTVLDRLGEGGMGIVYTAYDDQLDRKVAVKVLRGEATRQDELGKTRLLREAQAMARLSHSNIVTVHEVGDLGDQVYIAMEFIRGTSLDVWLRGTPRTGPARRTWREVLEVFARAGRGLEAAHKAGIIHRDFKPHNVLVGDDGAVKVLDFGLARAADHAGSEELAVTPQSGGYDNSLLDAPLTRTGAIMGTPAYMAPEQHQGRPATARSDQFAFCISLYEGLYGLHPFDCTTLGTLVADVNAGKIKEPPVSSRVPGWLRRALVRGLAVDPERRYPSMTELLAELARDPAAQRRRWLASAGLAGFVGAAGFGAAAAFTGEVAVCQGAAEEIAAVWDGARAEAVQKAILATGVPYAADTWERLRPRLDAYAADWVAMRGEACETHRTARQSDQLFDLRTACLDQRKAGFAALVDVLTGADASVVEKAVSASAALSPVADCGDSEALTQAVPPPEDPTVRARVDALRGVLARAKAVEDAGRFDASAGLVAPVLAEAESLAYAPLQAEALLRAGSAELGAGRHAAAERRFGEALWTAVAADHDEVAALAASKWLFVQAEHTHTSAHALREMPLARALARRVAAHETVSGEVLNNLGVVYIQADQFADAETTLAEALATKRRAWGEESPELVTTLVNLGVLYSANERALEAAASFKEASTLAERVLAEDHPYTLAARSNLGFADLKLGRLREAEAVLTGVASRYEHGYGAAAPELANMLRPIGELELGVRDIVDARAAYERALALCEQLRLAPEQVAGALLGLAEVDALAGDLPALREHAGRVVETVRATFGADHANLAYSEHHYGLALVHAGAAEEALAHLERAREIYARNAADSPLMADVLATVGEAYDRLGRHTEAEAELRRALALRGAALPPGSPAIAGALRLLGESLLAQDRAADAAPLLRRAVAVYAAVSDADYPELALTRFALARAVGGDEGRAQAEQAIGALRPRGPGFAREVGEIEAWLKGQAT